MAEIIVAFDVSTDSEAFRLADRLPRLRWAKVGHMLYLRYGAAVIEELNGRDIKVFLDLKWHDIPHAVAGAAQTARELGVDLASVHALGGGEMLAAAAEAAGPMRLAAVSVLTSHTPASYGGSVGRELADLGGEVERLVGLAMTNGLRAVVTSPHEVGAMRSLVPSGTWLVVPGIRPAGSDADDQRRTADPGSAAQAGATHLVVGRPITGADQPELVYNQICEAIA